MRRGLLPLLPLLAFAAAFLGFSVQPLLAKWLLPALGGSPATWASCLVFFQGMLVLGYMVAQLTATRRSGWVRLAYVALALAAIGSGLLNQRLAAAGAALPAARLADQPALVVLAALLAQVGLPFVLLASVAPLVQRWAAEQQVRGVHRLYAVSNVGSLAALIAYPIWIEPTFALATQWRLWSYTMVATAVFMLALALTPRVAASAAAEPSATPSPGPARRTRWLAYAAVPCALLAATTGYLTTDVAPVPLMWVVPLGLYLLTFIAAFAGAGPRIERAALIVFVLASAGVAWNSLEQGAAPLGRQLVASLAILTSGSLLCHIELVRLRPPAAGLAEFYVWIALGGALGSMFVALLAPAWFADYYEFELSVLATFVCLLARTRPAADATAPEPEALRRSRERPFVWLALGACAPVLVFSVWLRAHGGTTEGRIVERRRSFLGALRVVDLPVGRTLTHGRIRHGMQLREPELRDLPTMYYGEGTALERVFRGHHPGGARRVGVVGLGAGTIAALGIRGDRMRFYELDAQVIEVAKRHFSFVRASPAAIEIRLGDGRLGLERDAPQVFDLLVLDAFASDAVPVHLLTREAFGTYFSQLASDGVLLVNVANRHLALDRVVCGAARAYGRVCAVVETPADPARFVSRVRWAVISRDGAQLSNLLEGLPLVADPFPVVVWTDAHASLWSVLR